MAGGSLFDVWRVLRLAMTRKVFTILVVLFIGALLELLVGDKVGLFPSRLLPLITARDRDKFWTTAFEYALVVGVDAALLVLNEWITERLAVVLKGLLIRKIHSKYLSKNTFHDLPLYHPEIDNPDARIAQDCTSFAIDLASTLRQCVKTPIIAVWYSVRVRNEIGDQALRWCYGIGCFWLVLCRLVMIPVIKLTYMFEAKQAEFRGYHAHMRDSAEVVSLSHAERFEKETLDRKLGCVLDEQRKLAVWGIPLNVVTFMYMMLNNGLSFFWFYLFPPQGETPSSTAAIISRVSFVLIMLMSSIGSIFDVLSDVSRVCGYASRIHELFGVLAVDEERSGGRVVETENELGLEHADIVVPSSGRVLLKDVTFRIEKGQSLFVSGPSGCGKSSLFRVLGQLWPLTNGELTLPRNIMFLPQKAYIKGNSFDEALAFPNGEFKDSKKYNDVIDFLGLQPVMARTTEPWHKGLSPGERQKIAIARVFLQEPDFVLLDEATCAIPQSLEEKVFARLVDTGISFISIPHSYGLRKFHSHSLDITRNGDWNFYENTEDSFIPSPPPSPNPH